MPSLLEALQQKYFYDRDDCPNVGDRERQRENDKFKVQIFNNCSHNNNNHHHQQNNLIKATKVNSNRNRNNSSSSSSRENDENDVNDENGRTIMTNEKNDNNNDDDDNDNDNDNDNEKNDRLISIFVPRVPPLICVPQLLVLNDCDIDCAGNFDSAGFQEKCRNVRELDLAQNKLNDWHEISQICQHMPRIEFLNLSRNHLSSTLTQSLIMPIQNLRGIVLNGTFLNWQSIEILLKNLPILNELHLSLNNFNEIAIDLTNNGEAANNCQTDDNCKLPHKALRILHFTSNPIDKWDEICRFDRIFPNLEKLVLAKCPLTSVILNDREYNNVNDDNNDDHIRAKDHSNIFANLQYLNLNCTLIDEWENVDYLARLPKLSTLWVKNWPLWDQLECTEHERRQLLIARLPNVQILNGGGQITDDEREDAERSFIRYYMEKDENERPQRYHELINKHGKLEPLVNINLKPDKRIKIFLTYHDKTEARIVDIYRTVGDLKHKLEQIVGLMANQMRLYYVDQDYKDFGPEEMRFPNKYLYSYNIQPGDEIIVDIKKQKKKEKKNSTSEQDK